MMKKGAFLALLGGLVAASAMGAPGDPIYVANDGEVVATYLGTTASFSNDLYLDSPANGLGIIFNNHATPVGTEISLGTFTAGTELVFRIHVNDTGEDFYSGDPSRNPDGEAHADVVQNYGGNLGETGVFFEDLLGGPFEYNDLGFKFTNTTTVPEPMTCAVLGVGALGLMRRRRKS